LQRRLESQHAGIAQQLSDRALTVGGLSLERLQKGWVEATEGMRFAINFLKSNVGIDTPALLSSPFLIIVLAFYGHHKKYQLVPSEAAQLRRWALLASAKGRFSRGSTETILDQDLASVSRGEPVEALIDRVRLQFGRLEVTAEDLEGRDQRSSLFKTMFLAFRSNGAKDWTSNLSISRSHVGTQHKVEFHHFFPKSVLTKAGYSVREADDIANLTFAGGRTNRKIADKAPSVYAPPIIEQHGRAAFEQQAIPLDPDFWEVSNYARFLDRRRELLADVINTFLSDTRGPPTVPLINDIVASGENEKLEFKASLRWDVKEARLNKVLEHVVLKSIAALSNADGGTLLIGVQDDGTIFGLDADYASLDGDRDIFGRHLHALVNARWGAAISIGAIFLTFPEVNGQEICQVDVRSGKTPFFVEAVDKNGGKSEKLFVRTGSASQPIDSASELAAYINRRFPGYGQH